MHKTKNNEIKNNESEEKEQKSGCSKGCFGCLGVFVTIVIVLCIAFSPFLKKMNKLQYYPEISSSSQESFLDINKIIINVKCLADYEEVTVKIELYNEKGQIFKNAYLVGENYKKGKTYALTYTLSA